MAVRLGEIMIEMGLLTPEQVETILERQREDHRPFGDLAERLFHVSAADVDQAWAQQYTQIAERIDPRAERFDAEALALLSSRQAWQFRMLPIRRDGREIMVATTREHLPRALRFALRALRDPVYFVIAEAAHLGEALAQRLPLPGLTPDDVSGSGPWAGANAVA